MAVTELDSHAAPTAGGGGSGPLLTADGTPLKRKLAQAMRASRRRAFGLVAPLLAFITAAVRDPDRRCSCSAASTTTEYSGYMPNSTEALAEWDGPNQIHDLTSWDAFSRPSVFAAMVADLVAIREHPDRPIGKVATRVNRELSGTRSLITSTGRARPGAWRRPSRRP